MHGRVHRAFVPALQCPVSMTPDHATIIIHPSIHPLPPAVTANFAAATRERLKIKILRASHLSVSSDLDRRPRVSGAETAIPILTAVSNPDLIAKQTANYEVKHVV